MRVAVGWFCGAALLPLLAGCSDSGNKGPIADRKVRVVATTGMVADLARNVGGQRVEVTALMGPGVDPHLYKASARDVERLERADVVFYNGLHLEGQMAEVLEGMSGQVKTVAVTSCLDPERDLRKASGFEGTYDPHVWFDVRLWMKAAECVRDALIELDPTHADVYRANAKDYLAELDKLHSYVKAQAKKVPDQQRRLITAHDAFYYFGRAYGFEVRGLQGISTAGEAGTADVQELADFIARNRVPAIFVESSVSEKNLRAVKEAVRAKGFTVEVGGELYSDALGNPGTAAGTYAGMVRHNIDTIVKALKR